MFTSYMYREDRDNASISYNGEKIDSFSKVMDAINNLDGDRRPSLLIAEAAPLPHSGLPYSGMAMEIASGPDGYTCTIYTPDADKVFVMLSHDECDGTYRTIHRPYPDQIPNNEVVDKDDIIKAIERFTKDGGMARTVKWKAY